MKVLQFASYISIPGDPSFSRLITGYGYMVLDIADYISRAGIETDLITVSGFSARRKLNQINIVKRSWLDIFINLKIFFIRTGLKTIIQNKLSFNKALKVFFYYTSAGFIEKLIRTNNYNLVHIHGIGYESIPVILCCEKNHIQYLVTLHGLNSFNDIMNVTPAEKEIERKFLKRASIINVPVTVISSGIKDRILNYLQLKNSDTFYVITNGCQVSGKMIEINSDIREKYKISYEKKIMLCVGNIYPNKNQFQVVRAYSMLPESIKNKLVILFLGNDCTSGEINILIKEKMYIPVQTDPLFRRN